MFYKDIASQLRIVNNKLSWQLVQYTLKSVFLFVYFE